jgi:hypothetical protein
MDFHLTFQLFNRDLSFESTARQAFDKLTLQGEKEDNDGNDHDH